MQSPAKDDLNRFQIGPETNSKVRLIIIRGILVAGGAVFSASRQPKRTNVSTARDRTLDIKTHDRSKEHDLGAVCQSKNKHST